MTTLFVFAHPDDEAFGPAGTIMRLTNDGEAVMIVTMCNGARPGSEHVAESRRDAYMKSCDLLGAEGRMWDIPDMHLQYNNTCKLLTNLVSNIQPTTVYTNNISDINADHRLVAEACLVACRPTPTCSVDALIMCEIAPSTSWTFDQIDPVFVPNNYVDVSEYVDHKRRILELYNTETRDYPDARSVEATMLLAKYRGLQVGYEHAEAFKIVMSRQRR